MIKYSRSRGLCDYLKKICQMHGSVFPQAVVVALPCAVLTALLAALTHVDFDDMEESEQLQAMKGGDSILRNNALWSGFSFLVGFLIVFRTSQAYSRFWEGCATSHRMRAEWFDGCSSLIAFCRLSKAGPEQVARFENTLVRLFSMLHATALAEIEDSRGRGTEEVKAFSYDLIDAESLDTETLAAIKDSESKTELIFQWIQQLIVESIGTGVLSIPPPILSRSFQEIANGMVAFHEALKIAFIPFPFPYSQTCELLLIMHWLVSPAIVVSYTTNWPSALVFSFIQVFILWSLNFIAIELENPFGQDANDIDGAMMQAELNQQLVMLLRPETRRLPRLIGDRDWSTELPAFGGRTSVRGSRSESDTALRQQRPISTGSSFVSAWKSLGVAEGGEHTPPAHRFSVGRSLRLSARSASARSSSRVLRAGAARCGGSGGGGGTAGRGPEREAKGGDGAHSGPAEELVGPMFSTAMTAGTSAAGARADAAGGPAPEREGGERFDAAAEGPKRKGDQAAAAPDQAGGRFFQRAHAEGSITSLLAQGDGRDSSPGPGRRPWRTADRTVDLMKL